MRGARSRDFHRRNSYDAQSALWSPFSESSRFFRVAAVYDFIPMDWPGYFPTVGSRVDYLGKLAWLRRFDLFCPISEYTGWRLSELLGIPRKRLRVTGASVRRSYEICDRLRSIPSPYEGKEPYS